MNANASECSSPQHPAPSPRQTTSITKGVLPVPSCPAWMKKGFLCAPQWPSMSSADKKVSRSSPRPFAALRALRGQKGVKVFPTPLCGPQCPPRTKRFQEVLRAPPRPSASSADKKGLRCSPRPSVALSVLRGQKGFKVFFVVLRGPSWIKKGVLPWPFVDRPNYDLANLSSDKRQRGLAQFSASCPELDSTLAASRGYDTIICDFPAQPPHRIYHLPLLC